VNLSGRGSVLVLTKLGGLVRHLRKQIPRLFRVVAFFVQNSIHGFFDCLLEFFLLRRNWPTRRLSRKTLRGL
jgi:hypothetical protein